MRRARLCCTFQRVVQRRRGEGVTSDKGVEDCAALNRITAHGRSIVDAEPAADGMNFIEETLPFPRREVHTAIVLLLFPSLVVVCVLATRRRRAPSSGVFILEKSSARPTTTRLARRTRFGKVEGRRAGGRADGKQDASRPANACAAGECAGERESVGGGSRCCLLHQYALLHVRQTFDGRNCKATQRTGREGARGQRSPWIRVCIYNRIRFHSSLQSLHLRPRRLTGQDAWGHVGTCLPCECCPVPGRTSRPAPGRYRHRRAEGIPS